MKTSRLIVLAALLSTTTQATKLTQKPVKSDLPEPEKVGGIEVPTSIKEVVSNIKETVKNLFTDDEESKKKQKEKDEVKPGEEEKGTVGPEVGSEDESEEPETEGENEEPAGKEEPGKKPETVGKEPGKKPEPTEKEPGKKPEPVGEEPESAGEEEPEPIGKEDHERKPSIEKASIETEQTWVEQATGRFISTETNVKEIEAKDSEGKPVKLEIYEGSSLIPARYLKFGHFGFLADEQGNLVNYEGTILTPV